jgi:diphthamide synthase (EF-2-diphthine--ammonia ligase)
MVRGGIKATVTCVDPNKLDSEYAARDFDAAFLAELPASVDPCGENGEFHTFVFDAPVFSKAIEVKKGGIVEREGFVFADLL